MAHALGYIAYRALTCPLRVMPDFIVIGAQRGGTSAFYYHLSEHPCVVASPTKELNFFNRNFHKGSLWYRAHFPSYAQKRYAQSTRHLPLITGEASPDYMFHPLVPQRIAATLPQVKLIALLRNPIDRAYSEYKLYVELGKETAPFTEAVTREERRLSAGAVKNAGAGNLIQPYDSYLGNGLYAEQLERWLGQFSREQLLILRSEDFYADPAAILKQALAFLRAPTTGLPEKASYARYDGYTARPETRGDTGMDRATRERLQRYFAPHNARLYALLGRDFAWA